MRILYVASDWGLTLNQNGGAGSHIRGTIKGFRENVCEVLPIIGGDLLTTQPMSADHSGMLSRSHSTGIKRIIPQKLRLLLREMRYLARSRKFELLADALITEFKPDIVYERSGYYSFAGNRIARKFGIPLFLETDGCMVEVISSSFKVFSKKLGNRIEQYKLQEADRVVVYNHYCIPFIDKKFSLSEVPKVVKPLGIDVSAIGHHDVSRASLGIGSNDFVVGFVGTFTPYQGVQYLIDAAEILHKNRKAGIKFLLVGWGNHAEALEYYAGQHGLLNVIFTGQVDSNKVNSFIELFDIAIVPDSDPLVYPIKTLEYGLSAVCPLVPDYKVFEEIIVDGENGYVFRCRDAVSIADKIVCMMESRLEVKRAGEEWKRKVVNNFSWKMVVADTVEEMKRVILSGNAK